MVLSLMKIAIQDSLPVNPLLHRTLVGMTSSSLSDNKSREKEGEESRTVSLEENVARKASMTTAVNDKTIKDLVMESQEIRESSTEQMILDHEEEHCKSLPLEGTEHSKKQIWEQDSSQCDSVLNVSCSTSVELHQPSSNLPVSGVSTASTGLSTTAASTETQEVVNIDRVKDEAVIATSASSLDINTVSLTTAVSGEETGCHDSILEKGNQVEEEEEEGSGKTSGSQGKQDEESNEAVHESEKCLSQEVGEEVATISLSNASCPKSTSPSMPSISSTSVCTTTATSCTSSSIDINAATPVILPTLIETAEVQEEAVVIPVNPTKTGEQQQLSFPDVSQNEDESTAVLGADRDGVLINMSDPVPTSISDDPLRTPPRPLIEDRTSATDQNIAPAAPPASIPPPVVPVAPIGSEEDKKGLSQEEEEEEDILVDDDEESLRLSTSSSTSFSRSPSRSHWKKFNSSPSSSSSGKHLNPPKQRRNMDVKGRGRNSSISSVTPSASSSSSRSQVKTEPQETIVELDRLDQKIEKMRKSDSSALPGHASDHRVANYHSVSSMYLRRSTPLTNFHEESSPPLHSSFSRSSQHPFQSPPDKSHHHHTPLQPVPTPHFDRSRLPVNPLLHPTTTAIGLASSSLFVQSSTSSTFHHHYSHGVPHSVIPDALSHHHPSSLVSSATNTSSSRHVPSPSDMKEVLNLTRTSFTSGAGSNQHEVSHSSSLFDSLSSPSTVLGHHHGTVSRIPTAYHQRTNPYSLRSLSSPPPSHHPSHPLPPHSSHPPPHSSHPPPHSSHHHPHTTASVFPPSSSQSFAHHHHPSSLFGFPPKHIPTSIPVSVVTSLSDHLRKSSSSSSATGSPSSSSAAITGFIGLATSSSPEAEAVAASGVESLRCQTGLNSNGSISFRNNTAGRKAIPSSVISTGTRTTSRQVLVHSSTVSPAVSPPASSQTALSINIAHPQLQQSSHHLRPSTLHHHVQHHHQNPLMDSTGILPPALPAGHHHESPHQVSHQHLHPSSSHHHHHHHHPEDIALSRPPPLPSGNPSKPFKCPLCNKNLASKNVYQLHLRSHSGEKPFVCNLCGNAFSQKTSLTRHMRSHTGERPFPCSMCGKKFADKERIKIHMRTHTGEKPFACGICSKTFSQKSTVKRHMTVHTGEKPFKCTHCGKGFANRGNLIAHEKTHTTASALSAANVARQLALHQHLHPDDQQQQQQLHQQVLHQQILHHQHHASNIATPSSSCPPSPSSSHSVISGQQLQSQQHA